MPGKIERIITKSITRLARNTVDQITAIRELKEKNIAVYFENEGIDTLRAEGEVFMTVMGAMAQSEAEAVSSNVKWSIQRRFLSGTFKQRLPYGFIYDDDENIIPEVSEAEVVKYIFKSYMNGKGVGVISEELIKSNIKPPRCEVWHKNAVLYILTNPIYEGTLLFQKTFMYDCLKKNKKRNKGELPQYMIEDNHECIIPQEDFDKVQKLLKYKSENLGKDEKHLFTSKLKCDK